MWVKLTPWRGSAGHPWSFESCPWPHSPGNCWVLEKKKAAALVSWTVSTAGLSLCSRWVVWNVCVMEQTPCFCGQEALGHTRFRFNQDPKLSSFWACLDMVVSSRGSYNAQLTAHKQQLLDWRVWYSMFPLTSAKFTRKSELWHFLLLLGIM